MFHAASAQKYVDASTLTIIGRTCPMEGHPYYRVDTTRYRFDNLFMYFSIFFCPYIMRNIT